MTPVAVYRRTVRASLDRIWENVLDWEHLPWLHASSFLGIERAAASADGWRAWVTLPPRARPQRVLIDVRLERPERHYWTRTLEGVGTGTAIRTALAPRDATSTDITVEFFVPDVAPGAADQVGAFYTRLYTRLWDEDERMMTRRQDVLDRGRGRPAASGGRLALGPIAALPARLPLVVTAEGRTLRVVAVDGVIVPYVAVCPHLGGPLEDAAVTDGVVTCPWHGYRFDLRTGRNADGRSLALAAPPRLEVDDAGEAVLVWEQPGLDSLPR